MIEYIQYMILKRKNSNTIANTFSLAQQQSLPDSYDR